VLLHFRFALRQSTAEGSPRHALFIFDIPSCQSALPLRSPDNQPPSGLQTNTPSAVSTQSTLPLRSPHKQPLFTLQTPALHSLSAPLTNNRCPLPHQTTHNHAPSPAIKQHTNKHATSQSLSPCLSPASLPLRGQFLSSLNSSDTCLRHHSPGHGPSLPK
jgi:hypothetical protein